MAGAAGDSRAGAPASDAAVGRTGGVLSWGVHGAAVLRDACGRGEVAGTALLVSSALHGVAIGLSSVSVPAGPCFPGELSQTSSGEAWGGGSVDEVGAKVTEPADGKLFPGPYLR